MRPARSVRTRSRRAPHTRGHDELVRHSGRAPHTDPESSGVEPTAFSSDFRKSRHRQRLHQRSHRSQLFEVRYRVEHDARLAFLRPTRRTTTERLFDLGSRQRILRRAFRGFAFCTDDAVFRVSLDATLLRGERRVTDEARKRSAKGSRSRRSVLRRQARRAPSRCALRHGHRRAPIARHALASIFSSRAGLSHRIAVRSSCVRPGIDSTKSTGFMTAMPWGKSVPVTMRSTPTRSIRLRMIPG
jgi:hypothetical protein